MGCRRSGLVLPASGRAQVSLNVIDVEAAPLADVVARVREEAVSRGAEVGRGELVGLLPEVAAADPAALGLEALPDALVLERRLGLA